MTADREDGIATIWAVAWIFVTATFGWVGLLAATLTAAQHHVDGAADLVSLSAAARLQHGGDACAAAGQIARDNAVVLSSCQVEGDDVVVEVSDQIRLPLGLQGRLSSMARAGP